MTSPGLDKNAEDLTKALGEEKLRFRVAALDQGLAVVTIGGGEAMVAAALKNARGGGSIPSEPGTLEALKYMPSSRICVEMFNIGNLFAIIQKSSEGAGMLPVNFQSKTPITLGVGVSGSGERVSLYIPNDIIKDVTGLAAMFFGGAPGGAEQSPATTKPSDF